MNVVEPVLFQCRVNPFSTAIATPGSGIGSIKYGQLEALIHNVACSALKAGLAPGDVAAIYVADSIFHAALFLGLAQIGVVTIPLTTAMRPEQIPITALLTNNRDAFAGDDKVVAIEASWLQGDGSPPDYERIYRCKPDDPCTIVLTSGSTGRQKGVALSHRMLGERAVFNAYAKGPLIAKISRHFCSMQAATLVGIRDMMYTLGRGQTIYFAGPEPTDVLQYLAAYNVESLVVSPHDLRAYLAYFQADLGLSSPFKVVVCQGAKLSQMLAEAARTRLCQNLYTSYGATETSTVACGPSHRLARVPGAVGLICPGVTVEIVDDADKPLPLGQEGHIRIRTPHLAGGYVGDPETTARLFRDGAFYPGDVGRINAERMLIVTGRTKTALSVSGDTIDPEIIEDILCSFPAVEQAAAFDQDDAMGISRIHALIVASGSFDEQALRSHCATRLRDAMVPVTFLKVNEIPRSAQGKIDRRAALEIWRTRQTPT
ncbi:MAG: AMP-binding protein [Rhizobiales bacterium]|nr:AMP-binding protein [Hyphomicrobiales bacterium]